MNGFSELESFIARFYPGRKLLITPYAYTTTFLALAQGASASNIINIAASADFVLLSFQHRAQIAAAQNVGNKTAPFVRMLVTDSGSNEQYTNSAVDLENYSTNGGYKNALHYPRIISGRTALTVAVTNYAPTAETYTTLDITLRGVLVRTYSD